MDKVKDFNYITIEEVCEMLNCSLRTAREIVKLVKDKKGGINTPNGRTPTLYNKEEIAQVQQQQQQIAQCDKIARRADTLKNNNSLEEVATAFAKQIEEIPDDSEEDPDHKYDKLYSSAMCLWNIMMEKANKRAGMAEERRERAIKEKEEMELEKLRIEEEKAELEAYKEEVDNLYKEKYLNKELRAKINRIIRKRAMSSGVSYAEYIVELYKKYDRTHCFPYKDNYVAYIETIEKRGHLKEFYEMLLKY